jgi:hypothetical protein
MGRCTPVRGIQDAPMADGRRRVVVVETSLHQHREIPVNLPRFPHPAR